MNCSQKAETPQAAIWSWSTPPPHDYQKRQLWHHLGMSLMWGTQTWTDKEGRERYPNCRLGVRECGWALLRACELRGLQWKKPHVVTSRERGRRLFIKTPRGGERISLQKRQFRTECSISFKLQTAFKLQTVEGRGIFLKCCSFPYWKVAKIR